MCRRFSSYENLSAHLFFEKKISTFIPSGGSAVVCIDLGAAKKICADVHAYAHGKIKRDGPTGFHAHGKTGFGRAGAESSAHHMIT